MGQVFYEMGFLASKTVESCSTTQLIGEFVGHTGPKTQATFEKALGKVLFIDEAYRLADSSFGREALAEVTTILTLPRYKKKLVTILAGYDDEINRLIAVNPGLTSRFPEVVSFPSMSPENCCKLLFRHIKTLRKNLDIDSAESSRQVQRHLCSVFEDLSRLPGWGSGRDVKTVAENTVAYTMRSRPPLPVLTERVLYSELGALLKERQRRVASLGKASRPGAEDEPEPEPAQDWAVTAAPLTSLHTQDLQKDNSRITELSDDDDDDQEEDKIQEHLMSSGTCENGFRWNRVAGGWQCAGQSHFKSENEIRQEMRAA